ncbi:hypothetical protein QQF64_019522, partial [Cirrhinus molitorella]
ASGVGSDKILVSVTEGDSVIFHTGVETNQHEDIKWYFSNNRIAQFSRFPSVFCTDVKCNADKVTESFRDRLKLDIQTGSLTNMNIRPSDSGIYELKIISSSSSSEQIFHIVNVVPAAEQEEVKINEGESVTLHCSEIRKPNDVLTWYFNDMLIAQISDDPKKTCADVQCKNADERFRGRLEVNQNGSLTIKDTRNTDSGLYKLQMTISHSSVSITRVKRFSVTITAVPDSSLSSSAVAVISVFVFLLVIAAVIAGVIYYRHKGYEPAALNDNGVNNSSPNPKDIALRDTGHP